MVDKYALRRTIGFGAGVLTLGVALATYVYAQRPKEITLRVNNQDHVVYTAQPTVEKVLEEAGLPLEKAVVATSKDAEVQENMTIELATTKEVTLIDGSSKQTLKTQALTVGDLLDERGVSLQTNDRVMPGRAESLEDGMQVEILRVPKPVPVVQATVQVTPSSEESAPKPEEEEPVHSESVDESIEVSEVPEASTETPDPAEVAIEPTPSSEEVVVESTPQPADEVVAESTEDPVSHAEETASEDAGTSSDPEDASKTESEETEPQSAEQKPDPQESPDEKPEENVVITGDGVRLTKVAKTYSMESTAYTHTGFRTASGTWPKAFHTVAVDPRVIPLGTRLYVEGYGYAVAEDTGGAIKGMIIDVFFDTYNECRDWGRKYDVKVYVLED